MLLQLLEEDPRPLIRGTSAWALAKIQRFQNPLMVECIRDQVAKEDDPETIAEMTQAIERLEAKRPPRTWKDS